MIQANRQVEIDRQWVEANPSCGGSFSGERKMLYGILGNDEVIESMIGGTFRKDTDRLSRHKGVAVATNKRGIFLDKGIFGSEETMIISYEQIESVTHSKGMFNAGIHVIGHGSSNYSIADIGRKDHVQPFIACIERHIEERFAQPAAPTIVSPAPSVGDELGKLADLLERGLLTKEEFESIKQKLLAG